MDKNEYNTHRNSGIVGQWGLSGRSITLAKLMYEYRMDCSNDIEMYEPCYIYCARTTGPDVKFLGNKPCFLLRKFCFSSWIMGKVFRVKIRGQFNK